MIYEIINNELLFSNDKSKLQINVIHTYLSQTSYWAKNIPLEIVTKAIENSFCYACYTNNQQIAFARVITDAATFGYLADVFVINEYQGKGVGKLLIDFIMKDEQLKGLRRFMLATKDAHELYKKFGFNPLSTPERMMEIKPFETY